MERGDVLAVVSVIVLIAGLFYFYQNLSSFQCSFEKSFSTVTSDISYEFEPQGSLYSETMVFRFTITSSKSRLEYFGMRVIKNGNVIFFENRTEPDGGSILSTVSVNSTDNVTAERFFKKMCYPEVLL